MKFFLSFVFFVVVICTNVNGQIEKVIHQTFLVDSFQTVRFDLVGYYDFVPWAGNTVLVETSVRLYQGSPDILKYVAGEGRYEILSQESGSEIILTSKDKTRKKIKTKKGECDEAVEIRIFIPDDFVEVSKQEIVRKQPKAVNDNSAPPPTPIEEIKDTTPTVEEGGGKL